MTFIMHMVTRLCFKHTHIRTHLGEHSGATCGLLIVSSNSG